MKKKILTLVIFLSVLAGSFSACKEKIDNDITFLEGSSWKLVGIVDSQTSVLTEFEPKDCNECYIIVFDTDSTFSGQTTSNIFWGDYEIDYNTHTLRFANMIGTEVGEYGDGYKYGEILNKIHAFKVSSTTYPRMLHLYYNDGKNYLKYKEIGG